MRAAGQPALSAEVQKALDRLLYDAAEKGDAAAIERLAAEGASPNAKGGWQNGVPAVYMAALKGHAGAVSALAQLGRKPVALHLNVKKEASWDRAVQRPCVTAITVIYPDRNE